jgi:hypothetical protein
MERLSVRDTLLRILMLGSTLAAPDVATGEIWRRPLLVQGGLPAVEVWVGDQGPYLFVVDTGAEGSTISRELAARLTLRPVGLVEQQTVTGTARQPLVRVPEIRIGRAGPASTGVLAAVSTLEAMREVLPGVDGILGTDVLAPFDYLIDFGAGMLSLTRGEPLATRGGVVLPLAFSRNRPVVMWPRPAPAAPLPLALDTAADALVVDATQAAGFPCRPRTRDAATVVTHAGQQDVVSCQLAPVRAAGLELTGLRLVEVTWPFADERLDRGLLPASAFERVYVSASRGTLTLWPR